MTSTRISSGASNPKGGGVADIQFKNFITFFLKAFRFFQNGATNVITDIFEFAGFFNGGHES
ncbi:hypothetical protein A9Y87_03225 [Salmonella enterica subsp. enterica]|nr:hypothetical protein A9Y87_03225 [Salmonella enterica subsp. enterica]